MPKTESLIHTRTLNCPLFTRWEPQYITLPIPSLAPGAPAALLINGQPQPFQYTGHTQGSAAEIIVRLAFEPELQHRLEIVADTQATTDLTPRILDATEERAVGNADAPLRLPKAVSTGQPGDVVGPFAGFAQFPLNGHIHCDTPFTVHRITQVNTGLLFTEYSLEYCFEQHRNYTLRLRCFHDTPIVAITETFNLGMNARLRLALNPARTFDYIASHRGFDFEHDGQPTLSPINEERAKDVLCRIQMPPLGEYVGHNNRGWFTLYNQANPDHGMLGVLGLHGHKWVHPVDNIMQVYQRDGLTEIDAGLEAGQRHWLLYAGPTETRLAGDGSYVMNMLEGQFNRLRLDEHLDLDGQTIFDANTWNTPTFFGEGYRQRIAQNAKALPALTTLVDAMQSPKEDQFIGGKQHPIPMPARQAFLDSPETRQRATQDLLDRFALWVKQFQGYRREKNDYAKNVIGFARKLRDLMLTYELLRREEALTDQQVRQLNSYLVFAARRITDEGRWPHSKTWVHPDHPESVRDLYTYPGEHKPDKLIWTNSLPNFQSDPMCALAHLSCLIPEHPDADAWRQFAMDDIDRQLDGFAGESGAWVESIIYSLHTLSYFLVTFRALKHRCGIDYFNDPRVRRFVHWLVRFFGPYDQRFESYTWPGVGNARLPNQHADLLLAYAGELEPADPLRRELISVFQHADPPVIQPSSATTVAEMAPLIDEQYELTPLASEHMDELGVAMRHRHPAADGSYLFQKIGFAKDHYENDESAFNWYAKGVPLLMEYGTYTPDAGQAKAHNIVELPDMDALRRGYLGDHLFTDAVDYTRCEVPVTLKLLHGRVRSFDEVDHSDEPAKFFYLGDDNPIGPKVWRVRQLLFVKPDYLLLLDRVFGAAPHRYNLHGVVEGWQQNGQQIIGKGRFGLDVHAFIQHPDAFEFEAGSFEPGPNIFGHGEANAHRQKFFRLYNHTDGIYRTALFAKEPDRDVRIESAGPYGVHITTPEYEDFAFIHNERISTQVTGEGGQPIADFRGRAGWIRRTADGRIQACVPDGEWIEAFGQRITGRGPWHYNLKGDGNAVVTSGPPRKVRITQA